MSKGKEVKFENEIPAHCTGCGWIKSNENFPKIAECRYEGDYFDDFDVDTITLKDGTVVGDCHTITEEWTEEEIKKKLE